MRTGFIANLRLTPFGEGVVLPHEHTLSGPKLDRQKLMRATRAHFSQIFTLYRDPGGRDRGGPGAAARRGPPTSTPSPPTAAATALGHHRAGRPSNGWRR